MHTTGRRDLIAGALITAGAWATPSITGGAVAGAMGSDACTIVPITYSSSSGYVTTVGQSVPLVNNLAIASSLRINVNFSTNTLLVGNPQGIFVYGTVDDEFELLFAQPITDLVITLDPLATNVFTSVTATANTSAAVEFTGQTVSSVILVSDGYSFITGFTGLACVF